VLGAVLAAASLPPSARRITLDMVDRAVHARSRPDGMKVRVLLEGVPGFRPFFGPFGANPYGPGMGGNGAGSGDDEQVWRGVPAERRWAMEVLGLRPGMPLERRDVQQRFRRLVRVAHPDQGGEEVGAAERLNELAEAREVLLSVIVRETAEAAER
jgi:hypothetical protein